MEAQRTVMHKTGHVAFTQQQSEVLKQLYKTEQRAQQDSRKRMDQFGNTTEQNTTANTTVNSIQNPVTEEEANVLYNNKEGSGRKEYLKLQNKKSPKDRFKAPMTSSQIYGWDNNLMRFNASPYSRKAVLRNTCERPRGVFNPDLSTQK
eukprot:TRINITY_DN8108_c0_g1_i2.p1 TRINITY_DN8108_c0_g1~~TRINITY_DN8108_c0_g1_i2.p1  ORF type:complete len:171 (+),score=32.83 TRINITY_DN8108_c0_g1_i2:67-513(+)